MSTTTEDNYLEYKVKEDQGNFEIRTDSGSTVLVFRDFNSASQYASLLNQAFKAGYQSGYRAGRKV